MKCLRIRGFREKYVGTEVEKYPVEDLAACLVDSPNYPDVVTEGHKST